MKKLLIAAMAAAFSTSALAAEGGFYLRADLGGTMLPSTTTKNTTTDTATPTYSLERKYVLGSTYGFIGSIGAGYNIMDNVRTELTLSRSIIKPFKFSGAAKESRNGATTLDNSQTYTVAPVITSLHAKALVDAYNCEGGSLFAGVGVGISSVSTKFKDTYKTNGTSTDLPTLKFKSRTNFSYLLTAGTSLNISDQVKLDVAYTYTDHGTAKGSRRITLGGVLTTQSVTSKTRLTSHNVTAGIRYAL